MYENIFDIYAQGYDGLAIYALNGAQIGINVPTLKDSGKWASVYVSVPTGTRAVFTGRSFESASGNFCFQVKYLYKSSEQWGYIWQDEFPNFTNVPANNGEKKESEVKIILDELIFNNKTILENNLLCARIFEYTRERGIVLPNQYRADLLALHSRLIARNDKMKYNKYVQSYQESDSLDFSRYNDVLKKYLNSGGSIGLVITSTVAIVASIIILAGTFAAAYALFKSLHSESKIDYKYSNDLTAKLIKLLPKDTYEQLMRENAANVKQANKAIANARGGGMMNTLKYVAVGLLSFYAIDKFLFNRDNR